MYVALRLTALQCRNRDRSSACNLEAFAMSKQNGLVSLATVSCVATILFAAKMFAGSSLAEALPAAAGPSGYRVAKTISVGGEGSWDYIASDPVGRRVYVSHGTHVVVLDADTQEKVGD